MSDKLLMENDPLQAKDDIQSLHYTLLEEDHHRMTTATPGQSTQVSKTAANFHAYDQKWQPNDDLAH